VLACRWRDCECFVLWQETNNAHSGMLTNVYRAIETVIRVILEKTEDFDVDGPLEFSRMPEMGIISCPLRFQT
jgi:hypothetical protein